MRDQLGHVHPQSVRLESGALLGEIDGPAPVRVHHDRGQPLREERLAVAEFAGCETGAVV